MDGAGDHDVKQNQPNCENGAMKIFSYVDSRGERRMKRRRSRLEKGPEAGVKEQVAKR